MQIVSGTELQKRLEECGYWEKIHTGKMLEKIRSVRPAVITPEGESQIVSFWDEHLQYLCTIHRVITKDGKVIHEDIKDACINGIRYQVRK